MNESVRVKIECVGRSIIVPDEMNGVFWRITDNFRNVCGGFAAASLVVVTQVCTRDYLDIWLKSSVFIFAITIPILTALFLKPPLHMIARIVQDDYDHPTLQNQFRWVFSTKILNGVGFVLFFAHFGWLFAIIFLAASLLAWQRLGDEVIGRK